MNGQPEALRLAEELGAPFQCDFHVVCEEAAAELRRQHGAIKRLREEIERLRKDNEQFATLVGQYAAEQAPDALRMVVKDRDALHAENEKLLTEVESWKQMLHVAITLGKLCDEWREENERMREALSHISLCSQNSMSSKEECGRIARAALRLDEIIAAALRREEGT